MELFSIRIQRTFQLVSTIQGGVPFCFPPCAAGRLFCLVLLLFDTRAAGSAAVEIYAVFVEYAPY